MIVQSLPFALYFDIHNPQLPQNFVLGFPHPSFFLLLNMVMAEKMKHTVNDQQLQFIFNWMASLWGGSIRLRAPMMFAIGTSAKVAKLSF